MDRSARNYFIVIVLLYGSFAVCARNVQETFLHANQCYEQGDYEQALVLYNSLERKGSAVWYNLGNTYYHYGDDAHALVCYRRAERTATAHMCDDITSNIDDIERKHGITFPDDYIDYAFRRLDGNTSGFSLLLFQLIFLLSWYLFCFIAWWRMKGIAHAVMAGLFLMSTAFFGVVVFAKYQKQKYEVGVVMVPQLAVFAGPNKQYHELAQLNQVEQVAIIDKASGWLKIRRKNDEGWVEAEAVMVI